MRKHIWKNFTSSECYFLQEELTGPTWERRLIFTIYGHQAATIGDIIDHFYRLHPLPFRTLERIVAYYKIFQISTPKNPIFFPAIIAGLCIMKVIRPQLYDLARSGALEFGQVSNLFRFTDWRDQFAPQQRPRISVRAEASWRFALNAPSEDQEMESEIRSAAGHANAHAFDFGPRTITYYCEILDGFSFPNFREPHGS